MTGGINWPERQAPEGADARLRASGSEGSALGFTQFVQERVRSALSDQFEVRDLLGQGGMALVFLARRLKDGRAVALKVLREDQTRDSESLARFEREAELAIRLRHPNIVETLGVVDIPPSGRALILEYMAAGNLSDLLERQTRMTVDRAVAILTDAATALEYAHGMGVVHRDVKPDNIFIAEDGRGKLGDFGIARQVGTQTLNLHGMAIGSTHYMSPEQIEGAETTGRSDLYSLGCVGWQLLAGQAPWAWEPTLQSIIRRQLMEQLPPLQHYRMDVPEHVLNTLAACLEKSPERRPASARDVIDALAGRTQRSAATFVSPSSDTSAATRRFRPGESVASEAVASMKAALSRTSSSRPTVEGSPPPRKRPTLPAFSLSSPVPVLLGLAALALSSAGAVLGWGNRAPEVPQPPNSTVAPAVRVLPPQSPTAEITRDAPPVSPPEVAPPVPPEVRPPPPRPDPPTPPPVELWPESRIMASVSDLVSDGRYMDAASLIRSRSQGPLQTRLLGNVRTWCQAEANIRRERELPGLACP